jgi:hypothetical protein
LQFSWDENKNRSNYRKHTVFFETAVLVFDDPKFLMIPDRTANGEERWQTIGLVEGLFFLLVVHTLESENEEERVRIISAREATVHERRRYEAGE